MPRSFAPAFADALAAVVNDNARRIGGRSGGPAHRSREFRSPFAGRLPGDACRTKFLFDFLEGLGIQVLPDRSGALPESGFDIRRKRNIHAHRCILAKFFHFGETSRLRRWKSSTLHHRLNRLSAAHRMRGFVAGHEECDDEAGDRGAEHHREDRQKPVGDHSLRFASRYTVRKVNDVTASCNSTSAAMI